MGLGEERRLSPVWRQPRSPAPVACCCCCLDARPPTRTYALPPVAVTCDCKAGLADPPRPLAAGRCRQGKAAQERGRQREIHATITHPHTAQPSPHLTSPLSRTRTSLVSLSLPLGLGFGVPLPRPRSAITICATAFSPLFPPSLKQRFTTTIKHLRHHYYYSHHHRRRRLHVLLLLFLYRLQRSPRYRFVPLIPCLCSNRFLAGALAYVPPSRPLLGIRYSISNVCSPHAYLLA